MKNVAVALVAGASLVACAAIGSQAASSYAHRSDAITVTGLGEKPFSSDLVTWKATFVRRAKTLSEASSALSKDRAAVAAYLQSQGVPEKEASFNAVASNRDYSYVTDDKGQSTSVFEGYTVSQEVSVRSSGLDAVAAASRGVTALLEKGIEVSSQQPEYFYTKLGDLKLELAAKAAADARARAEKIVEAAGGKLGALQDAGMGVFQITARDSGEDYSGAGAYNTSAREKVASVTVRVRYGSK